MNFGKLLNKRFITPKTDKTQNMHNQKIKIVENFYFT